MWQPQATGPLSLKHWAGQKGLAFSTIGLIFYTRTQGPGWWWRGVLESRPQCSSHSPCSGLPLPITEVHVSAVTLGPGAPPGTGLLIYLSKMKAPAGPCFSGGRAHAVFPPPLPVCHAVCAAGELQGLAHPLAHISCTHWGSWPWDPCVVAVFSGLAGWVKGLRDGSTDLASSGWRRTKQEEGRLSHTVSDLVLTRIQ